MYLSIAKAHHLELYHMSLKLKFIFPLVFFLFSLSSFGQNSSENSLVELINPLIGTGNATTPSALKFSEKKEGNAQVVPFVSAPFGMTQWTPETQTSEQKCVAPYYYKDSQLTGFRASHWLSGSCTQDYGSVTLMPTSGDLKVTPKERASQFSHEKESSKAYLYKTHLDDYDIQVAMTATTRAGILQIDYKAGEKAHLIIHPNSDEGAGFVAIHPEKKEVVGYNPAHRIYQGWGESAGFSGYFVVQFDQPLQSFGVYQADTIYENQRQIKDQKDSGAFLSFDTAINQRVEIRIGTSFTSIEAARANLEKEMGGQTFNAVEHQLKQQWETLLQKIKVESENTAQKETFYTALYHSALLPRIFNDANGDYIQFSSDHVKTNIAQGNYYVDFSMWDTFRALHPLLTLWSPQRVKDMMQSLYLKAAQGGWLPIFPAWNNYTAAMIGDHVQITLADAVVKGLSLPNDQEYAYLIQNAFESPASNEEYIQGKGRRALDSYLTYNYIPLEDDVADSFHKKEQVSRTLEYAFDDFGLYQLALIKGDSVHAEILKQRALNYKKVFSPSDLSVRGRYADGTFIEDFDNNIRQSYITEGTPFQYTWFVPHDVQGLMQLMGGQAVFNQKLDELRNTGQYWHGNEPGHHIPFLYNYSGQAWKTQAWVKTIADEEYGNGPGGLSGNDDAGQMSAWYVFASLGFYPVTPSVPQYVISGPRFEKITLELEGGKRLVINAIGADQARPYIQEMRWNGKPYEKTYLQHSDLIQGGVIDFVMGEHPNLNWGTTKPYSLSD